MSAHRPHDCSRADAVLALYLDGDIGVGNAEESGFDFVCPETLAEHLASCETCATNLCRARRLDALLAEQAGEATARTAGQDTTLDELLQSAIDHAPDAPLLEAGIEADLASSPAEHRGEHRAARMPTLSATLALLLVFTALLTGWTVLRPAAATTTPAIVPESRTAEVHEIAQPATIPNEPAAEADLEGLIVLADGALRINLRPTDRPTDRPTGRPTGRARPARAETLLACLEDAAQPDEERLVAAHELLGLHAATSGNRRALSELCAVLASGRIDPALQAEVLRRGSRSATFSRYLHDAMRRLASHRTVSHRTVSHRTVSQRTVPGVRRTEELGALVVATRTGDQRLDERIRSLVQRRPKLAETVASALRTPVRSTGSARLLLGIWNDLQVRRQCDDDRTARTLFAGQPAAVFAEVVDELAGCRSVPGRVRCLLALGWSGDRQITTPLLARAAKGCRRETHAAAWALSQLPHVWLDDAVRRAATDREAFVLRAALARARLPAAAAWTTPLELTRAQLTELVTASHDHFPRCAEWFRDGPTVPRAIALATED